MKTTNYQLQSVFFRYDKKPIINNLSLDLNSKKTIGIIGPNGSGKTTLLKLLAKQLKPESGDIKLNQDSIQNIPLKKFCQQVTYVPQHNDFQLNYSVYDFVSFGRYPWKGILPFLNKNDHEIIMTCIEQTGLSTYLKRPINQLSGGEQQRSLISRSLATTSNWILFDEPTTGLDLKHVSQFFKIVKELTSKQEKSILMSIHDINHAIQFCDEILLLKNGAPAYYGNSKDKSLIPALEETYEIKLKSNTQLQIENPS